MVVIDAGIASEGNLKMLKLKGHHYLCVARGNTGVLPEKQPIKSVDTGYMKITR
jgi:hypothetical protein